MTTPEPDLASQLPPPAAGMTWVPGGTFGMGSDDHYPEEAPSHEMAIDGFWIDRHQVTNGEFAVFAADTGYETVAERPLDPTVFPDLEPEKLTAGSMVFSKCSGPVDLMDYTNWWAWTPEASWRTPEGPESDLDGRQDHPVVHVAHEDAVAYSNWAGKELPTEAEWEKAARGGLERAEFVWGSQKLIDGRPPANWWQGEFPWQNTLDDGYERTAPVGSFAPNGFGLYDLTGNVWEWTDDWFTAKHEVSPSCCVPQSTGGNAGQTSFNANLPSFPVPRKVVKGGSFLCADNYCMRYRPAARQAQDIDTGMSHIGFRCVTRFSGSVSPS